MSGEATYQLTDYECCAHCQHETDGGPPHEDPCPEGGCTAGQKGHERTVAAQAREDARQMWRTAFGTDPS